MKIRIIVVIVVVIISGIAALLTQAPDTSTFQVRSCIENETGDCIRFPTVSGENLNGETVTLPDFFAGDLNLVIVPFDREQQESVIDWLPLAQELQAEHRGLRYYSVGALPDVPAPVRLLISSGMSLAVDNEVREVAVLLYLEDQDAFADALNVSTRDEMYLFVLNDAGEVLWHKSGAYSDTLADTVRAQVALLGDQS